MRAPAPPAAEDDVNSSGADRANKYGLCRTQHRFGGFEAVLGTERGRQGMIQQQLGDAAGLDRRSTRSHVAREQARAALLADASRGPVATDADDFADCLESTCPNLCRGGNERADLCDSRV